MLNQNFSGLAAAPWQYRNCFLRSLERHLCGDRMQSLGDNRLASFSHDIACVSFQLKTSSLVTFGMTLEVHTMWTVASDILVWRELWNLFYTPRLTLEFRQAHS